MSKGILYDSLLVRDLARELDRRLAGRRARVLRLDADRRVASLEADDGGLVLDLHPTRGWITLGAPPPAPALHRLHRTSTIRSVSAPEDERLLRIDFGGSTSQERPIRSIVVELMTNQWNVIGLDGEGRIVAILWPRRPRDLRVGSTYVAPAPAPRLDAGVGLGAWGLGELIRRVAYTSPLNAGWILGDAEAASSPGSSPSADAIEKRWRRLVDGAREPVVLETKRGLQPYPVPIEGAGVVVVERTASLLEAMRVAAGLEAEAPATGAVPPELLERVRSRLHRLETRAQALEREIEEAGPEADRLRGLGDLLLARLHTVPRGADVARVEGWDGQPVEIELDPALDAAANANRLYEAAKKRSRARSVLPPRVRELRQRAGELRDVLERAESGEATEEEVAAALPAPGSPDAGGDDEDRLPYRRYRTSGGLEVRVGRGAKGNDDLTFHHSSPNDVWLHARDVGGAHVILRWNDGDANPPARDLAEAAVLAALNSKARTSGTVPVDWTRRKYVRKPRKAPPGLVTPDRVKTVFVEPDEAVERRMRVN